MDIISREKVFPYIILNFVITEIEHDKLCNSLQMKNPSFLGFEIEDIFSFTINYHERLLKMGIMKEYDVE